MSKYYPSQTELNTDDNGNLSVEQTMSYSRILGTAATTVTTVVKSGAGVLHSITVCATSVGTITVYDNTAGSGDVIAVMKASIGEGTYTFDVSFATGLTVVTTDASDVTVSYR